MTNAPYAPAGTTRSAQSRSAAAFTLVEILIVVIILGILAAIVIPQFTNAATDARKTTLATQVKDVRTLIELYRLQHEGRVPDLLGASGWSTLTATTTRDGTVDPAGPLGPYMPVPPVNPLTNSSAVAEAGTTPAEAPGWYYDDVTGDFYGANADGVQSVDGG